MKSPTLSILGLVLAAVLVLLVNVLAGEHLRGARIDTTDDELYTLTTGSKNIAAAVQEPITLRMYFSSSVAGEEAPEMQGFADRVEELLREYVAASSGELRLEVIDPEPFSDDEDDAVAGGLQGVPIGGGNDVLYFGLVGTNLIDGRATIPFFSPSREHLFEYEISRLIYELTEPARPRVGVLSSLGMLGMEAQPFPGAPPPAPPWIVTQQMSQLFDVVGVNPTVTEIDPTIDILVVHHPKDLAEPALYAIDQFALSGGHVVVCVDPHSEEDTPPQDPNNPFAGMNHPRGSDLNRVLSAWGLQMAPGVVAADASLALKVRTGTQAQPEAVTYVPWLEVGPEQISGDDLATDGLTMLRLPSPGVLTPMPGADTTFEPLVTTTDQAMQLASSKLQFFPDPKQLLEQYEPGQETLVIAARISGTAQTAFPNGRPGGDADTEESETAHRTSAPINAVVIADADFIADPWWVQVSSMFGTQLATPVSDNGNFFVNVLDTLVGNDDLIGIRSRGTFARPFTKIDALRLEAEKRYLAEERRLQDELRSTDQRIAELQREREDGSSMLLTDAQLSEIEKFQEQRIATRKKLRDVRHELDKDIEGLQSLLTGINVLAAPLAIVLLLVLVSAVLRRRSSDIVPGGSKA